MALAAVSPGQAAQSAQLNQLINLLTGVMNDQPVTLKADNTHPVILKLDTVNASQAVVTDYLDAGVLKWEMGKGTTHTFGLWDNVRGNYVLSAVSNGDLTMMAGGGRIGIGVAPNANVGGVHFQPSFTAPSGTTALGDFSGTLTAHANSDTLIGYSVGTFGGLTFAKSTFTGLGVYGFYVNGSSFAQSGTGTIANAYALYATAPSIGTINWAAYFSGNVGVTNWLAIGTNTVVMNAGDLQVNRGGASPGTGAIFFGSSGGAHYILYDGTKFLLTDSLNVTGGVTSGAGGVADATTYQSFLDSSAGAFARTLHQTTLNVGTTATAIINQDNQGFRLYFTIVHGNDGTNYFGDVVLWTTGAVSVITSVTDSASPAARTYSTNSNGQLKLAMASGSYKINAFALALNPR